MIAEGNETPGGDAAGSGEGRGRRSEGDLLAERRARRAAESGEHALTLRAEAAEATVRTLETHVASLQQRLQDAERDADRMAEPLEYAPPLQAHEHRDPARGEPPAPREASLQRELQRASQREYAEQRLRVEAEDRGVELERESRAEIERLGRRLSASERDARTLGARLESLQRELAEAEQTAATERAQALDSERALRGRVHELEAGAERAQVALAAERSARQRAERLLDALRSAQRSAVTLLGGLADTVARLREASAAQSARAPSASSAPVVTTQAPADIPAPDVPAGLPAAPPRAPAPPERSPEPTVTERDDALQQAAAEPGSAEMAEALAAAVERLRARVEQQAQAPEAPLARRPAHKHSMSLITRTRLALRRRSEARKQRRQG